MTTEDFITADIGLTVMGGRTNTRGNARAGLLAAVAVNVLMWAVVWPTVG
jgi:hypothetical protein